MSDLNDRETVKALQATQVGNAQTKRRFDVPVVACKMQSVADEAARKALDSPIVQAAETRFRPILMTTASMVFGMMPLALGLAEGAEFRQSMGTVLVGGLLSSLLLTLFLVPVMFLYFAKRAQAPDEGESPHARGLEAAT